jgi:hypothetical protein
MKNLLALDLRKVLKGRNTEVFLLKTPKTHIQILYIIVVGIIDREMVKRRSLKLLLKTPKTHIHIMKTF